MGISYLCNSSRLPVTFKFEALLGKELDNTLLANISNSIYFTSIQKIKFDSKYSSVSLDAI